MQPITLPERTHFILFPMGNRLGSMKLHCYLLWQLCRHVCARLSRNLVGHQPQREHNNHPRAKIEGKVPQARSRLCVSYLLGKPSKRSNGYLVWQVCWQDCVRISQLLRQGTLNVIGQARRQDESSLEHFAKHASTPPVFCPLAPLCAIASNVSSESSTTQKPSFI
jgi:hypothetical protein